MYISFPAIGGGVQLYAWARKSGMDLIIPFILIAAAELLLYAGHMQAAMIVHGINLVGLALAAAYVEDRSFQALMLLPLFRLLNIAMPVFFSLTLYSYILVYAPMFLPVILIIKERRFTSAEIGFRQSNFGFLIPLGAAVGLVLGWMEYNVIHPERITPDETLESLFILTLIMIIFVGFIEEFIFRSALQTVLEDRWGSFRGLVGASVLFGLMHSGYHVMAELFFVTFAGMVFGYFFQRTRNLAAISVAHGVTNVSLFMITPINPSPVLPVIYVVLVASILTIGWKLSGAPSTWLSASQDR